ncbi:MAG TPA: YceI family protein [Acidimicrobiales bacterium]|jgi:polyisoprenoid-binding protein YceI
MSSLPAPGPYTVDAVHTNIDFVARHLVASKVRGNFTEFSGVVNLGDSVETSSVEATVQAASITTHNEMRDNHLKSSDFLELETYPTLTLKSTKITPKGGDDYELVADLTIKDVTKSVVFDLEYLGTSPGMAPGVNTVAFEAKTEIDRRDFNVNFNAALDNGGLVVSNKVAIELTIEALSPAA